MTEPRQHLLELLAERSFKLGQFKLSSGGTSDYYIDCRTTTLHAEGARLTGRVILDEIKHRGWNPHAVGGMTMGADPIVTGVSILSAQSVQTRFPARSKEFDRGPYWIHGFLVRKAEKAHGTAQRVEGFVEQGAKVVIVDDVCTTGASTIGAIEATRAAGMEVVGVICLVEREEAAGRANVEKAAGDAPFLSIFKAAEIRAEHIKRKDAPPTFAVNAKCDMCDRPAVTNIPSNRCEAHKAGL
jgi:orotate phosphoribosyltransferase